MSAAGSLLVFLPLVSSLSLVSFTATDPGNVLKMQRPQDTQRHTANHLLKRPLQSQLPQHRLSMFYTTPMHNHEYTQSNPNIQDGKTTVSAEVNANYKITTC